MFSEILSVILYLLLVSLFLGPHYFLGALLAIFAYLLVLFIYNRSKIRIILPFFIPFLLISLFLDLGFSTVQMGIALGAMIVFFPFLLVHCWDCEPLTNTSLEEIAKKAKFSHAGFKVWNTPGVTAAIIGLTPLFRYVLLTKPLISRLSPEALEAVVAHEIGHSKNHHLIWSPIILSGSLVPLFFVDSPSIPFYIFYALFILLYFRFIFGFYSRLFEREADLFGLKIGIPLPAMQDALDQVGVASGLTHRIPSWHHFSLYERIEFLKEAEKDPALEKEHSRRVTFWKWIFIGSIL